MSALFITATGTDCGKTFVTAGLVRHLRALGLPARALKPVVSGFDEASPAGSDPAELLAAIKALGLPCLLVSGTYLGAISHTLTALAAMRAAGCAPRAIAVNESEGSSVSMADTMAELAAFAPGVVAVAIRRGERDFGALARGCGLAGSPVNSV